MDQNTISKGYFLIQQNKLIINLLISYRIDQQIEGRYLLAWLLVYEISCFTGN